MKFSYAQCSWREKTGSEMRDTKRQIIKMSKHTTSEYKNLVKEMSFFKYLVNPKKTVFGKSQEISK